MFAHLLQLVCGILAISMIPSIRAQATATASENGIVSAAGGPEATQSVSYSIVGGGLVTSATTISASASLTKLPSSTSAKAASTMNGTEAKNHDLATPIILGIIIAAVLAVVGMVMLVFVFHKRRRQVVGRAKRKSIMDAEFGASRPKLQQVDADKSTNIGYFDIAKPLPVITHQGNTQEPMEDDRLSRSSTIIADAAEIAQIKRKASVHQTRNTKSREQQRERNHALQILTTNGDNRATIMPQALSTSNPSSPTDLRPGNPKRCLDGNGDAFAERPSKI